MYIASWEWTFAYPVIYSDRPQMKNVQNVRSCLKGNMHNGLPVLINVSQVCPVPCQVLLYLPALGVFLPFLGSYHDCKGSKREKRWIGRRRSLTFPTSNNFFFSLFIVKNRSGKITKSVLSKPVLNNYQLSPELEVNI